MTNKLIARGLLVEGVIYLDWPIAIIINNFISGIELWLMY